MRAHRGQSSEHPARPDSGASPAAPLADGAAAAHLPVVALVGRMNVGKSTLFNRLCGGRRALVANVPGLTRDRQYGHATVAGGWVQVIDTGGVDDSWATARQPNSEKTGPAANGEPNAAVAAQVDAALAEADVAVLVTDAREGLASAEGDIARQLRRRGTPVLVAVNKMDAADAQAVHEFAALGFGDPVPISATHGRGLARLGEALAARLPALTSAPPSDDDRAKIAVIGRPNVGKSTLVNRWLGMARQVVLDQPGTTRDAIDIPFGHRLLIDTAGVRRKGKTSGVVEKFSVVKTLDALRRAHVAVLVADAREGIVDQDLHILQYAANAGAGIALALNKCDGMASAARTRAAQTARRRLGFAPWIPVYFISALRGTGVTALLAEVDAIHRAGVFAATTADINRSLAAAIRAHPPPVVRSRQIKLRYAHKAGGHPPTVVVHGNQTEALPPAYLRYLASCFRNDFQLVGVPVRVQTQSSPNPFAGRRNELTRRQRKRRERVTRHRGR